MFKYITTLLLCMLTIQIAEAQLTISADGNLAVSTNDNYSQKVRIVCTVGTNCGTSSSARHGLYVYTMGESSSSTSWGIYGYASKGYGAKAVYGYANSGANYNHGVSGGAYGTSSYGGYFTSGLYVSGGITQSSDERLKKNIRALNIEDISAKIRQLKPQRYEYMNAGELKQRGLPVSHAEEGDHFGLLAQELEKVFPELVSDVVHVLEEDVDPEQRGDGEPETVSTKAINYQELTVVLLAAVQELQEKVQSLEQEIGRR